MRGERLNSIARNMLPASCIWLIAGCSWLGWGKTGTVEPAKKVAQGAKIVAVTTARTGALVAKIVASGTYRGSRKVVTWTSARTVDGTTATLKKLNLIERPVPQDILEELPDELLTSLTSLDFVKPEVEPEQAVISSSDSRWEGEVLYKLGKGGSIEVRLDGPAELIVVTLAGFLPEERQQKNSESASYTVYVEEDELDLGQISFESGVFRQLSLYGYPGWRVSSPGVFVVKALAGAHRYRLSCKRSDSDCFLLVSCFLPRYELDNGINP
ncbi:MAG: hypothetical protein A3F83_01805 [Candidatus Glassbacteria bacterium RIFCSPLOWO2_12_FULL_58_11]|uniref:Uncharacterized protein n=1 Tax=Candidatus Glassbacteria bacterium RIFCSPLOWO2_12_FULL_58_11 TaxID=1817867 RepID=A0A1F5Z2R8_9BACT|nr:MAG: hypothetical protein A3F83_01805 [Candidatus Glassbacteria bacterium RIFCSPLOWO2_12_FULL_58_11]